MFRLRHAALVGALAMIACASSSSAQSRDVSIPPPIEPTIRGNSRVAGLEAKAETYRAIEDSLAAVLDSTVAFHRCASRECIAVRGQLAELAFKEDSLKGRIRELEHDIAALDSTAATQGLGPLAPPRVPPVPVDSQKFHQRRLPKSLYLGLLGAGTQLGRLDRDTGGYDATKFYRNKFVAHYTIGYALESTAERLHVSRWLALPATCVAAHFFDKAQGFYNKRDVVNGCLGAATSFAVGLPF